MRNFTKNNVLAIVSSVALLFAACGDDSKNAGGSVEDQEIIAISDKTVTGVSQKGPFVNGSSVTVQELNGETLAQTGLGFEGKIKNDMGEFSVKVNKLESQYALLKANGFYRNEVTGEKSRSQVTLYALTDLSKRDEVNVNLLTHLSYERSLYLATEEESVSVAEAKKQAETEVLKSFEIEGDFDDAEDLNIFGESDQSAALLAVSVLMQGNLSEGDFSERLANYAADIESDGVWNDTKTATQIADWAITQSMSGGLALIRNNIAGWKLSTGVPAFEKYVDNFWWRNYGLGTCDKEREGEVKKNQNAASVYADKYFICRSNLWYEATALEYDTYEKKCDEDGKIVFGNVNKEQPYDCDGKSWRVATEVEGKIGGCIEKRFNEVVEALETHYICEKREWREATDIEKDTYKWKDGKDGDVKNGDVVKSNCYVFEDSSWRSGYESDCSLELRGCTKNRQDTVGLGKDNVWYICDAKSWREAINIEKDTFGWKDSTDGSIKKGNVTDVVYVFDKTVWRMATEVEGMLGGCIEKRFNEVAEALETHFICENREWRLATDIEKDTYKWKDGKDGDVKNGDVVKSNCYVFEDSSWCSGSESDCALELRGCTKNRQDTVGLGKDNVWYICDAKNWRKATNIEQDTATWGVGKNDGEIRTGQINKDIYYMYDADKKMWRNATSIEIDTYDYEKNERIKCLEFGQVIHGSVNDDYAYFCYGNEWKLFYGNEAISYGRLIDKRDGQIYRTVEIGSQTWMAENLNFADESIYPSMINGNWCYKSKSDSCIKYGRLYSWSAAIDSIYWAKQNKKCGYIKVDDEDDYVNCGLPQTVKGICPEGWHVPNNEEWNVLYSNVGNDYKAMQAKNFRNHWKNSSDDFGFSALPSGVYDGLEPFAIGENATFWSASEFNGEFAYLWLLYGESSALISGYHYGKIDGHSVRCIKDEDE
ncbi:fibrobacter succinogenes major paralogous domain-containing protein [Fibrobacter sp. UWP2]|uniref:fibrobacter succinogenes major paralogous domain-containing protein n=1 Tax=Fibrobacter sp. UWP2 TaxID=1896216 RepID=UPI000920E1F9|nr:fibrobacter succinogenes major paralogous domain-containing protein [Fibrobacter sp. UWP2]SHI29892.1 major paralogous domain-containing protein [Fibrobacter sp. UWP2]